MDLEISITSTMRALEEDLERVLVDQLPFATAKALTMTGNDARRAGVAQQSKRFNVRRADWPKWSIPGKIGQADKRDWPNPHITIGTQDESMLLHETGGTKRPVSGRSLAIPTRALSKTTKGRVRADDRPGRVLSRKNAWKEGGTIRRRTTKRNRLSILYFLRPKVSIKPAKPSFRETITGAFEGSYPGHFIAAYSGAIQTRRRK